MFSPNSEFLANVISRIDKIEIYDFNNAIGTLTYKCNLPVVNNYTPYIPCFSPGSNVLYCGTHGGGGYAWDMSLGDTASIQNSQKLFGQFSSTVTHGPDGNLYAFDYGSAYLAKIDDPDNFANPGYNTQGIWVNQAAKSLPYFFPHWFRPIVGTSLNNESNFKNQEPELCDISLYSIEGKLIYSKQEIFSMHSFHIKSAPQGIYILKIFNIKSNSLTIQKIYIP